MSDPVIRLNAALEGRYRIERELGEGGMATVYLAEDIKHNRKVALKVLKPELAAVVGAERFLAEIQVTANLQHPNILPLFDSGEAGTFLFYVMPYVEGETLREKLEREHQLSVDEALRLTTDVAEALQAAHEQGVIHRDIKPGNILLSRGRPLVADFGIALAVTASGGDRLTETGLSMGTPHYMSPEQAAGESHIDARSDIYSLGAVLYELLAGEPPHTGRSTQAIIAKLLTEQPTPLRVLRNTVPEAVDRAVMKALAKVPPDRFATTAEFAKELYAEDAAVEVVPEDLRRVKKQESGALAALFRAVGTMRRRAVGAVVVALTGLLAFLVLTRDRAPPPATSAEESTESADARGAYLRGETHLRELKLNDALVSFREALDFDPNFAMAYYRHSILASWSGLEAQARQSGATALRLADRAPERFRGVIHAIPLFAREIYTEAIPLVEAVLEDDPDNVEALYLLNEFEVHQARDSDLRRGAELLERVLELDPRHPVVNFELPLIYGLRGEFRRARNLIDSLEPNAPIVMQDARAVLAWLEGNADEALRRTQESGGSVFGPSWRPGWAALASRWDLEEEIETVPIGGIQGFWRAGRLAGTGNFFATRGRFEKAIENYREAAATAVFQVGEGLSTGVPATALISLAELLSLRDTAAALAEMERALALQPESPRGHYFAGWFALRLRGDVAKAEGHLDRLSRMAANASGPSGPTYRDALEAELALVEGDTARALPILERIAEQNQYFDFMGTWSSSGAAFQDGLVRAYLASGDKPRAIVALETLIASGLERSDHPVLYVRALYELGLLQIELGDRAEGRRNLERFLEHWGEVEWDLPEVADARNRLGRS